MRDARHEPATYSSACAGRRGDRRGSLRPVTSWPGTKLRSVATPSASASRRRSHGDLRRSARLAAPQPVASGDRQRRLQVDARSPASTGVEGRAPRLAGGRSRPARPRVARRPSTSRSNATTRGRRTDTSSRYPNRWPTCPGSGCRSRCRRDSTCCAGTAVGRTRTTPIEIVRRCWGSGVRLRTSRRTSCRRSSA